MIFTDNPNDKKKCEECPGRRYPAGDYCEGCQLRQYRR